MILSDDIDMKLNFTKEPRQLEKTDVDFMSTSCDVHVIFSSLWPISSNPEAWNWNWNWNALFHVDKIIEKKQHHTHKMYNTSSSSYQSICLIKVNLKIIIIITIIIMVIISKIKYISK